MENIVPRRMGPKLYEQNISVLFGKIAENA